MNGALVKSQASTPGLLCLVGVDARGGPHTHTPTVCTRSVDRRRYTGEGKEDEGDLPATELGGERGTQSRIPIIVDMASPLGRNLDSHSHPNSISTKRHI